MTSGDANEAFRVLDDMLNALGATFAGQVGRDGAQLRYAIGDLRATGLAQIRAATLASPLSRIFMLATSAGATLTAMDAVRLAMAAQTPIGNPGKAVANTGIRFALEEEVWILAASTFTSSSDVFDAIGTINGAFEAAEEYAADNRDPASFQALIALHAAAIRDLTTRACALPKLVTYRVPAVLTSHALAYRLYGDASRCDELRAENRTIHPGFMPLTGTCLSD